MSIPKPKTYQQWKEPTIDLLMDVIHVLPQARRIHAQLLANELLANELPAAEPIVDDILEHQHEVLARWRTILNVGLDTYFGDIQTHITKPNIKKPKTYKHWRLKLFSIENFSDNGYVWAPYIPINL